MVNWLIEEYVVDDDPRLLEEAKSQGHQVKVLPHQWRSLSGASAEDLYTYFTYDECVVFHGSLDTARIINRSCAWYPGTFFKEKQLHCTNYLQYLEGELLNSDYYYLPLYEVFKRLKGLHFVRPDNPNKTFAGMVIEPDVMGLDKFLGKSCLTHTSLNELVLVAKPKAILNEIRAVVLTTGEVLSASYYKIGDETVYQALPKLSVAWGYLSEIAKRLAPVDQILTLDIAKIDNGSYKVIEIGSVSTSSLYEADFKQVVGAMSSLAHQDYSEQLEYI